MKNQKQLNVNVRYSRIFYIILQFFNGVSALAGGYGLILDPSGATLDMNVAMLNNTPFTTFLIPGIVLLAVNGVGNLGGAVISVLKYRFAPFVAALFGFILMIWMVAQVAWIGYQSFLQPLYFITGLLQVLAAYFFIVKTKEPTW